MRNRDWMIAALALMLLWRYRHEGSIVTITNGGGPLEQECRYEDGGMVTQSTQAGPCPPVNQYGFPLVP